MEQERRDEIVEKCRRNVARLQKKEAVRNQAYGVGECKDCTELVCIHCPHRAYASEIQKLRLELMFTR